MQAKKMVLRLFWHSTIFIFSLYKASKHLESHGLAGKGEGCGG